MNVTPPAQWADILHQLEHALLRGAADPDTLTWIKRVAGQLDLRLSHDPATALLELNVLLSRLAQFDPLLISQVPDEAPPISRDWSGDQLDAVRELLTRDAYRSLREIAALVRLRGWTLPEVSIRLLLDCLCHYPYVFLDVADLCGDYIRWTARQDPATGWLFPTGTPDQWPYPHKRHPAALFHWIIQCPEEAHLWLNKYVSRIEEPVWMELLSHYGHLLPEEFGTKGERVIPHTRPTTACRVSGATDHADALTEWFRAQLAANASPLGEVEETFISLVPRDRLCSLLQEHLHGIRYQLTPGSYAGWMLSSERLFWTEELTRDVLRCFQYRPALVNETRTDTDFFKAIIWRGHLPLLVRQLQSSPPLSDFPLRLQKESALIRELLRGRFKLYKAFQP